MPILIRTLAVCLLIIVLPARCGPVDRPLDLVDSAIQQIEATKVVIQKESSAWRNELPKLQSELNSLVENQQAQATADVKEILSITSNDIRSLTEDTIQLAGLTAEQITAKFGTEARCNVDFARSRVSATLDDFTDRLKFWKENKTLPPPPPHSVCQVTPDKVELHSVGGNGGWSMKYPSDKLIGVYGYDFRSDAVPAVELQNREGTKLRDTKVSVSYVTRYQINLNFGSEELDLIERGARYVLRWPDQPEPNAISVALFVPSRLEIVSVDVPGAARARAEAISPTVRIANKGGTDSGPFTIRWTPAPGEPVRDVAVQNLAPEEERTVTFPAFTYTAAGNFRMDLIVTGGGGWNGMINITPYANTPRTQSMPVRGEWPDGGGDKGDVRPFHFQPIILGDDCVLDTTRGGGGFEVEDIDKPEIKYQVQWPAAFDFGFGGNTFWRSFSRIWVDFDGRAATPTVELKGLGGHSFPAKRGPERFNGTFTVYSMCPQ